MAVTFAAGYVFGVFCAVWFYLADTLKLNQEKGTSSVEVLKRIGFGGLWNCSDPMIILIGTLTAL